MSQSSYKLLNRKGGGSISTIMFNLWLLTIKLICIFSFAYSSQLDYRYACLDQSSTPPSTAHQTNLNKLLSLLSSDSATSNGFGTKISGINYDQNNMIYGLYFCRGDVNASICHSCVENASKLIKQQCPNNATAILWCPFCLLRYSNNNFFGKLAVRPRIPMFDATQNFTSVGEFDSDARILMNGLIQVGSQARLMFGTHMFNINGTQRRYGWVQCSRDITKEQCRTCLSNMLEDVENCCKEKRVWRIFSPSCVVMYETQPFFLKGVNDDAFESQKAKENDIRSIILTTVVGTGIVVVTLLALCTNYFRRLKQKQGKFSHSIMIFNCSCSFVTNLYIAENYWKMLRMRSKLRLQFRCRDFKIIYTATAIAIAVTLQTFILRKNTRKCSRCYRNFDFVAGTSKSFIYCYHNCDFRYATNLYNATKCSQCDQNCYFVGETSKSFVMRL
ncbi:cysteine-rich repeat secretory protein 38-like [Cicer arietinum]|uniref:cysteine-rich repeat secretory protein 38-like n=1 Tax=Cicer arietinum TaxID=3827 RepID=UPI003CC68362